MKLEKSLYLTMCGHDCEPNMFLKIPIIVVWPVQLEAHAVATWAIEKQGMHEWSKQNKRKIINPIIVMAGFKNTQKNKEINRVMQLNC